MTMMTVADVAASNQVFVSLIEVTAALTAMGLKLGDLHAAIDAGEVDRDSCTANNPPTDSGGRAHGTTVRVLRERHIPSGWAACDAQNFSTVVSPDESLEIAVASGDRCDRRPVARAKDKEQEGRAGLKRSAAK